jgi:hypothetical protein
MGIMKAYMAFDGDPQNGAALVFAESARQARKLAWDTLRGWFDSEWINVRVRRLREHEGYLLSLYDGNAVLEDPPTCDVCETWGAPLGPDGNGCENCGGNDLPHNP